MEIIHILITIIIFVIFIKLFNLIISIIIFIIIYRLVTSNNKYSFNEYYNNNNLYFESQPFEINSVKYINYPVKSTNCDIPECNNDYRGYICPSGFTTC
jgi:hypothetical protein